MSNNTQRNNNKEIMSLIKEQLQDAMWEYKEAYSLQREKSDLIETNSAMVGELVEEDQHDWLWLYDSETRAADIKEQIANIRMEQSALWNELDRREINPYINKEFCAAEERINQLKEQLKEMASYCDSRAASQREAEEKEMTQEHSVLYTLRAAYQKALHGYKDRGYWRWAKKLVQYADNARDSKSISVTASKKIKLGAYMLMNEVAKNNAYENCEWIADKVDQLKEDLEEWNKQFDISTEIPADCFGQKHGLSVKELEFAIDYSRVRGFKQYTRTYRDDAFFALEEEEQYGWASSLVQEIL